MPEPNASPPPRTDKFLDILLAAQLVLGALWTLPIISNQGEAAEWMGLFLLLILYPIHGVIVLIAAWYFWKRPDLRWRAGLLIVMPVVLFPIPWILEGVFGDPVLKSADAVRQTIATLLALVVILVLVFPRRVAEYVPRSVLRSTVWNVLILLAPIAVYVPYIAVYATRKSITEGASPDQAGWTVAYALIIMILYAAISFVPALLTFLYSYVGLFQRRDRRRVGLHIAQLVLSSPPVVLGVWVINRLMEPGLPGS